MQTLDATAFAPAQREDEQTLRAENELISKAPLLPSVLDNLPSFAAIVNDCRQIVFANQSLVRLLESFQLNCAANSDNTTLGQRPGEALNCVHAENKTGGCGTTEACRSCGAVLAILGSQAGKKTTQECRMLRVDTDGYTSALDLRVTASPIFLENRPFSLVVMEDISSDKRRLALERIFFHDILNTATGIQGLISFLAELNVADSEVRDIAGLLTYSADALVDEIQAHRTLNSAERNDLTPYADNVEILGLLNKVAHSFAEHEVARERYIKITPESQPVTVLTDPNLLRRVIVNLLKNALEASKRGETVTLTLRSTAGGWIEIDVHNTCVMRDDVKKQVFNRSFSTRGLGRGLGAYSVRLITERYLKGKIQFKSEPGLGTVFTLSLPPELPEAK
jgi:signal transduction histidine kinase